MFFQNNDDFSSSRRARFRKRDGTAETLAENTDSVRHLCTDAESGPGTLEQGRER